MDRPLISFMLFAYNQENYVRRAVEAAMAQTYSPLEIILSDDASSDGTFDLMRQMAGEYRGPHQIRLNRNPLNLGIGGHVNRLMELARGELIVVAAGDDISLPNRVEQCWQAYRDSGGTAMSIYSGLILIDENERQQGTVQRPLPPGINDLACRIADIGVCGCSHCWHRSVFDIFGPMIQETVYEDKAIPFRSILLGRILYLDEPLVLYRRHTGNISAPRQSLWPRAEVRAHVVKKQKRRLLTLKNYDRDLRQDHAGIKIAPEVRASVLLEVLRQVRLLELDIAFNEGSFRDRVRVIGRGMMSGVGINWIGKWFVRLFYPFHLVRVRRHLLRELRSRGQHGSQTTDDGV